MKKGIIASMLIGFIVNLLIACGSEEVTPNAVGVSGTPSAAAPSNITPFSGVDPLDNVQTFIGSTYKDVDPDVTWLATMKARLDAMKPGELLSSEEYAAIVQRQTEIQAKYDTRQGYYQQLETKQNATILPHTAVEFDLDSYCMNANLAAPLSGSVYDEVVPIEEHIRKVLQWYYTEGTNHFGKSGLQLLLWDIQDYVHNDYDYESALTPSERGYLEKIFPENPEAYLDQMRSRYADHSLETNKVVEAATSVSREQRNRLKDEAPDITITKDTGASQDRKGYFNLGDGLVGRFLSKSTYHDAKLEVINSTDKPIKFQPFDFMLKQQGKSSVQPVALGARHDSTSPNTEDSEKANQALNVESKNPDKPTCNMTAAHRQRIIAQALPTKWEKIPYKPKNSRSDGVVCNQYVWMVYDAVGLSYPSPTPTWEVPSSPFFEKITKTQAHDGDVVLWLNKSSNVHHMGLWLEHPETYGGDATKPLLSAREHGGNSTLPLDDPKFEQTVDWTNPLDFNSGSYEIYRFKGAGPEAPNCPVQ